MSFTSRVGKQSIGHRLALALIKVIMQWARENDYVVFTHDLDFSAILAATKAAAPSVIQLRIQNILPKSIATTVVSVIRICQVQLEEVALITIDNGKQRIRILPL